MRLIDADALIDWLKKPTGFVTKCEDCEEIDCLNCTIDEAIKNAPTIEAEPVRHGRWKVKTVKGVVTIFECSECRETLSATNDYFGAPTKHIAKIYPYCHCGAKMDGGA